MGVLRILLHFLVISGTAFSLSLDLDVSALISASNKLAMDLHGKIGPKEDGNVVTCPLTISTILGMMYYDNKCKTKEEEMRRAFGYQNASIADSIIHSVFKTIIGTTNGNFEAKEYVLRIANAVFIPEGSRISSKYKNGMIENYNATVYNIDFEKERSKALDQINDWVKSETNNQIEKLLDDIHPPNSTVLLNAVYLKAKWKTPFDPKDTTENVFYNKGLQSEKTTVLMMHLVAVAVLVRFGDARVIVLPYESEDIVMLILLSDTMDGAYKFESLLSPTTAKSMMEHVEKVEVHVSIPKFKMALEKNLNTGFRELGIKNVLEDNTNLGSRTFFEFNEEGIEASLIGVSGVVLKETVKTNEKQREASEVTKVVTVTALKDGDNKFDANFPFLIAMLDTRTNAILFQSRVSEL